RQPQDRRHQRARGACEPRGPPRFHSGHRRSSRLQTRKGFRACKSPLNVDVQGAELDTEMWAGVGKERWAAQKWGSGDGTSCESLPTAQAGDEPSSAAREGRSRRRNLLSVCAKGEAIGGTF